MTSLRIITALAVVCLTKVEANFDCLTPLLQPLPPLPAVSFPPNFFDCFKQCPPFNLQPLECPPPALPSFFPFQFSCPGLDVSCIPGNVPAPSSPAELPPPVPDCPPDAC